jgi:hypothetical protein
LVSESALPGSKNATSSSEKYSWIVGSAAETTGMPRATYSKSFEESAN